VASRLADLGWDAAREDELAALGDGLMPARVTCRHHGPCELRRLERYLVAIAASGAAAAVVVNKADAAEPRALEAALRAAGDMPAYAVSAATGVGLPALRAHLRPGRTAALVGSSGVGKSTLVNRLAGRPLAATRAISAGGRGHHTTTRRDLYPLRGHGVVIDTPGMRELALWAGETAVDQAFADVLALAAGCRFTDCAHRREPGCAVRAAIARGELPPDRLAGYRKLVREVATLERRRR
jgi:ribosome biogenesis GTPase